MSVLEDEEYQISSPNNIKDDDIEEGVDPIDPIEDIIDYLVRCAKISFKNAHVDEAEVRTNDKKRMAHEIYKKSPSNFLSQFGKYMAPYHMTYFENLKPFTDEKEDEEFRKSVELLKTYHSDESRKKRVRNRRYKAMQKLQNESDYFNEKEMMFRNPLLYEQLVGQFLTDNEVKERDLVDNDNLTFLSMILDTVDRNQMRETKNEQFLSETLEATDLNKNDPENDVEVSSSTKINNGLKWGEFEVPDTQPDFKPEIRKQTVISVPERHLLREEFLQEMYSSFIEGRDLDIDYQDIDNNEQYDDLLQVSRDAEDEYFDSESNDIENLEQHMHLVEEYGRKGSTENVVEDTLDVFMDHLNKKHLDS